MTMPDASERYPREHPREHLLNAMAPPPRSESELRWTSLLADATRVFGSLNGDPGAVSLAALASERHQLQRALERERAGRERAEAALAQSQSLHQATIESTEDGLLVVDMAGRIISYNRRYLEVWGVPEAIALAGDDEAALALEAGQLRDPEAFVAKVRELYASPEAESFDTFEFKDGRIFERYSRPQRIGTRVVGRVLSFRDVTERTQSLRRKQLLLEASTILGSSLDYEQTLRELAQLVVPLLTEWCQVDLLREDGLLHVTAEARLGQSSDARTDQAGGQRCFAANASHPAAVALKTGEPVHVERISEDVLAGSSAGGGAGSQSSRATCRSVFALPLGARGRRLGAIIFALPAAGRSYTPADQELMAELARRAALAIDNAQLYEAALLANQAKADFLAVMSHELRTPLTAIMGYTELLADGVSGPVSDVQRDQLQRVDASARHLLQLIEAILAFARIEAGREEVHLEPCDLRLIASEVAMLIQPVATKQGLQLVLDLQPDMGLVRSDPGKIRQILINLLSNAVKFTERGGLRVAVFRDGDESVLRVSDTGVGIAPEHIARIFDPFWQVEQPRTRRVGGTGLGLSVTRHLARMLGGDVRVTSKPGVGSTFTVRLRDWPETS
jgi:PAS domain S-box-containing protein